MFKLSRRSFLLILSLMMGLLVSTTVAFGAVGDKYTLTISGTYEYGGGQEMLAYINEERAKQGADPLTLDKDLTDAAMQRAAEIAFLFDHTRTDGSSCFSILGKAAGENIAAGNSTAAATYEQWKNSSGHYANMINGDFQSIGIGHFTQGGPHYWVQLFSYGGQESPETRTGSQDINTTIDVLEQGEEIRFNLNQLGKGQNLELMNGEAFQLIAGLGNAGWDRVYGSIEPESFVWTSSDENIVTVNDKGIVTAKGIGTATITAKVNNGSFTKSTIDVKVFNNIENAVISGIAEKEFNGSEITQEMTVSFDGKPLNENVDYTVSYSNNVDAGTAFITIRGIGAYGGAKTEKFTIRRKDLSDLAVVHLEGWDYSAFASEHECLQEMLTVSLEEKTLVPGKDYYIYTTSTDEKSQLISDIGISFIGNYQGTKYMHCLDHVYVAPIRDQKYTGSEVKPEFVVYWSESSYGYANCTYKEGVDYQLVYHNNVQPGTATVEIVPIGDNYGSSEITFEIVNPKYSITFKENGGTVSKKNKVVTYRNKVGYMPAAKRKGYVLKGWYTAKTGGKKITASTIYEYKNSITLYARWKKVTVAKAKVAKLQNKKGKKLLVTAKKVTGAKGYQIVIAKNSKFTKGKKTLVIKKGTSKTISKLSKTKYYVKVRAYKTDSTGKRVYGKFSNAKTIRIKR